MPGLWFTAGLLAGACILMDNDGCELFVILVGFADFGVGFYCLMPGWVYEFEVILLCDKG